jgi:hypothetical protein
MYNSFSIFKLINVTEYTNRIQCKVHVIISIDIEKALGKIQHPFHNKSPTMLGIRGTYCSIINAVY